MFLSFTMDKYSELSLGVLKLQEDYAGFDLRGVDKQKRAVKKNEKKRCRTLEPLTANPPWE
jgi:hypothetical protein